MPFQAGDRPYGRWRSGRTRQRYSRWLCAIDGRIGYRELQFFAFDGVALLRIGTRRSSAQNYFVEEGWILDPLRASIRPTTLILNDLAPSTNSTRTVREKIGIARVLDGPGNRTAS